MNPPPNTLRAVNVSTSMKDAVEKLADEIKDKSCVYNINLLFTNPKHELKVQLCEEIESITITQDFVRNYTDKIICDLRLNIDPYQTLGLMRSGLVCRMQLSEFFPDRADETLKAEAKKNEKEITLNFMAILLDYEDPYPIVDVGVIAPEYNGNEGCPKYISPYDKDRPTFKLKVELVPEEIFKARKLQMHGVFNSVKMLDMLRYSINYFNFDRAMIVEPDNDNEYTNFVVPPAYGMESVMSFMQNAPGLGVYKNGFCSYITRWWKDTKNLVWFVYPRYGDPVTKNIVNVYSVGANMFTGLNRNHISKSCSTSMLITDELAIQNWSDLGTENFQTGVDAQISDGILDGTRELQEDEKWKATPAYTLYTNVPSNPIDKQSMIKIDFMRDKGNVCTINSALRTFHGTTIKFTWHYAEPWVFTPGTIVTLFYDKPKEFKKFIGMCEGVEYQIMRDKDHPLTRSFISTATVTLNCDNVEENKEIHV